MQSLFEAINWHPQIGDPTIMGWLTVFAYFLASAMAFKLVFLYATSQVQQEKEQRFFWFVIALIMLMLGINKQLDLQSLFTQIAKFYAHKDSWYEDRRRIQIAGIVSILYSMFIIFIIFSLKMKKIFRNNKLAFSGLIFLLCFIAIRATSFHHMDIFINTSILGMRMNWILELSGIFAIMMSALLNLNRKKCT